MNKKLFSIIAGATILATSAFAKNDTWYVAGNTGIAFPTKLKVKEDSSSFGKFKTGYSIGTAVGYSLDDYRFEIASDFYHSKTKDIYASGSPSTAKGKLSVYTLMANALYDIPVVDQLDWTVGAGLGWAHLTANLGTVDDSDNCFAYQFITGPTWNINDEWAVTAHYTLLSYTKPKFKGVKFKSNYINSVKIGVRYSF